MMLKIAFCLLAAILLQSTFAQHADHPGDELERYLFPWNGCSRSQPCTVGQGDCDGDHECQTGTKCGLDNCRDFNASAHPLADCCVEGNRENASVPSCQQEGVCGPNALCKVSGKNVRCSCPERFAGVPTPQQGCVRIPARCPNGNCSAKHTCKGGLCHWQCQINANCARGERCLAGLCSKVCRSDKNCLQGEICIDSTCQPGCNKEEDCRPGEICRGGLCVCAIGFIDTPSGCQDINECDNTICHPSANCANIPGSFKCTCPSGLVGDPYTKGCKTLNECTTNKDCGPQLGLSRPTFPFTPFSSGFYHYLFPKRLVINTSV